VRPVLIFVLRIQMLRFSDACSFATIRINVRSWTPRLLTLRAAYLFSNVSAFLLRKIYPFVACFVNLTFCFAAALSQLTSGLHLPDCPVCMEPMEWGISGTIASCGHLHCITCVKTLIALDQKCPTCRAELKCNWRIITQAERALPDVAAPGCSGPPEFPIPSSLEVSTIDFGSKFAAVITQINVILRTDPTAKILVISKLLPAVILPVFY
jgi:hypothetical protein